jgi:hypothetical protein
MVVDGDRNPRNMKPQQQENESPPNWSNGVRGWVNQRRNANRKSTQDEVFVISVPDACRATGCRDYCSLLLTEKRVAVTVSRKDLKQIRRYVDRVLVRANIDNNGVYLGPSSRVLCKELALNEYGSLGRALRTSSEVVRYRDRTRWPEGSV